MPSRVELKPPAKKPYIMVNIVRSAMRLLSPQKRNTPMALPREDIRMTVVAARWSPSIPMTSAPGTEAKLKMAMRIVPVMSGRPRAWAYEARYVLGRK